MQNVLANITPSLLPAVEAANPATGWVLMVLTLALLVGLIVALAMGSANWKWLLVVLVLVFCGVSLWPPADKLQLGLDLRGGTSLLYQVNTGDRQDPSSIKRAIRILQDRVDPQGTRNLIWRVEGNNRLEIQMPMPSRRVLEQRRAFDQAREAIKQTWITRTQVLNAFGRDGEARVKAMDALSHGLAIRAERLKQALQAFEKKQQVAAAYQQQASDTAGKIDLAADLYEANLALDQMLAQVLATNLSVAQAMQIAELPSQPIPVRDEKGRVTGYKSSPRQQAVEALAREQADFKPLMERFIQSYDAYANGRGALDDPNDLIRLLKGAGVLEFRIAPTRGDAATAGLNVDEFLKVLKKQGPRAKLGSGRVRWYLVDDEDRDSYSSGNLVTGTDGRDNLYVLLWDVPGKRLGPAEQGWKVVSASESRDDTGMPAVSFNLNSRGGDLMSAMSSENIGQLMAIVLDGKVYSVATIRSMLHRNVQISRGGGGYTRQELNYLLRVLQAGSLDVQLSPEPISIRTVGPTLGGDNLRHGLAAALWALVAVGVFMMIYYFLAGAVADLALVANLVIILGVMAALNSTFTLPGIAGIVLTIGMCVDANVLIFERIREELKDGQKVETALRLGYQKAFSSIIDGNLTNLIVCFILFYFTTADVKGFATTLGIGICATLFTALFMTRVIFEMWNRWFGMKSIAMLPMTVTAIDRLLKPDFQWINRRVVFYCFSLVLLVGSIVLITLRGADLMDIEFQGGTEVAFRLAHKDPKANTANAPRITMTLSQARDRVQQIGGWFAAGSDAGLNEAQKQQYQKISQLLAERRAKLQAEREESWVAGGNVLDDTAKADIQTSVWADTDLAPMGNANVVPLGQSDGLTASEFGVRTTVSDAKTVAGAVRIVFADVLSREGALQFTGDKSTAPPVGMHMAVESDTIGQLLDTPSLRNQIAVTPQIAKQDISAFRGGVAFLIRNIQDGATIADVTGRIRTMRLQPDFQAIGYRPFSVIGLKTAPTAAGDQRFADVLVLVRDEHINSFNNPQAWRTELVAGEWQLVRAALSREKSMEKVSNFTPTVAETMAQQALIALLLSILAIVGYIWIRFGSLRYGLAAIAALVHDVLIAVGLLALAGLVYTGATPLANALLIGPFKINMGVVAALLTIIGYSLNDTIVLFDRIRENRGRLAHATGGIINDSINQTISRTMLTSFTTFLAVFFLYVLGGEGIRAFAFCLIVGVIVGTYSSIAIASPLLLLGMPANANERAEAENAGNQNKQDDPSPTPEHG